MVAIAVTVVTAGATAGLGPVLSGAISGAAGAAASQAVGVATGIQDKFSFKGVALAALSGGVGAGVGAVAGTGAIAGSQVLGGIVRGVAGSAITQGIAVATGLQKRFDWVGVAAAGVSGGVIAGVGGAIGYQPGSASAANIGRGVVAGIAGDLANAATRSLIEGSDFGDNVLAGLPDVIAQTVGNIISGALRRQASAKEEERRAAAREDAAGQVTAGRNGSTNAAANTQGADAVANARTSEDTSAAVNGSSGSAGGSVADASLDLSRYGYAPVTPQTREQNNAIVDEAERFTRARTDVSASTKQNIISELEDRRSYYNGILPGATAAAAVVAGTTAAADVTSGGTFSLFGYNLLSYGSNGFQFGGKNGVTASLRDGTAAVSVGGSYGVNVTANVRIQGWHHVDLSGRFDIGGPNGINSSLAVSVGGDSLYASKRSLSIFGPNGYNSSSTLTLNGADGLYASTNSLRILGASGYSSSSSTVLGGTDALYASSNSLQVFGSGGYESTSSRTIGGTNALYESNNSVSMLGSGGYNRSSSLVFGGSNVLYSQTSNVGIGVVNGLNVGERVQLSSGFAPSVSVDRASVAGYNLVDPNVSGGPGIEAQFEANSLRVANEAHNLFVQGIADGSIPRNTKIPFNTQAGGFVDQAVRRSNLALRDSLDLNADAVRINQRLYTPAKSYTIPDLYFPGTGNIIDYSYQLKTVNTPQIQGFRSASPNGTITIVPPSAVRPVYVVGR